jgi:hypothetical protein
MQYLNLQRMHEIQAEAFRSASPYPWINPQGFLTEAGYERLLETLPDVGMFERRFGQPRAHGQKSHDRFALEYARDLAVAPEWHEFVAELEGPEYQRFLRRMMGTSWLRLTYHWHYTPNGCSVSPHCDNRRKLGSHIFYLNTAKDWDPAWGGETVILDDAGRFSRRSAPAFEDFDRAIPGQTLGNRSLLFARKARSWHGVREIRCPEGRMRKVFIVVINRFNPVDRVRMFLGGPAPGY